MARVKEPLTIEAMVPPKGFEGVLTGRVVVKCSNKDEVLDLPEGSHILELLSRAETLFGCGCLIDHRNCVRTSTSQGRGFTAYPNAVLPNIRGGCYVWIPAPPDAGEMDKLYVCQKKPGCWPHFNESRAIVEADKYGAYSYEELAGVLGFNECIKPEYIVLGDPEIMRIYEPGDYGDVVLINRSTLGEWGTRGKHVPMTGGGWWTPFLDLLDSSRVSSPWNWKWI